MPPEILKSVLNLSNFVRGKGTIVAKCINAYKCLKIKIFPSKIIYVNLVNVQLTSPRD